MSGLCETCAHWMRGAPAIATATYDPAPKADVGACCIMPPQLIREGPYWATAAFPQTQASRSCGEWEPEVEPDGPGEREPTSNIISFDRSAA